MKRYNAILRRGLWISLRLLVAGWLLYTIGIALGCARIAAPQGGPKDSTPPVLLRTVPNYAATNYKKDRFSLYFDENIEIKDPSKIIVSPAQDHRVTFTANGRKLSVQFNDPLKDSTTYQVNFGTCVVDNRESNPFPQFSFAFSTGPWIDSLRMEGRAVDVLQDMPYKDAMAFAYLTHEDSVVLKRRPDVMARSDQYGMFMLEYLKDTPYKVVLVDDANNNMLYDQGAEAIGFFDGTLNPSQMTPPEHWFMPDSIFEHDTMALKNRQPQFVMRMFKEEVLRQFLSSATRKEQRAFVLQFYAPHPVLDSLTIDSAPPKGIQVEYSALRDTMIFWMVDTTVPALDTLNLSFTYLKTDTANNLTSHREKHNLIYQKPKPKTKEEDKKGGIGGFLKGLVGQAEQEDTVPAKPLHWQLKPQWNTAGVGPIKLLSIDFTSPLLTFDQSKIKIEQRQINPRRKDTTYTKVPLAVQRDSMRIRHYTFGADWKEKTTYRYMILPEAFVDIYGLANDTIQGEFLTVDPEQLSVLALHLTQVQQQYVVQITDTKGEKVIRQHIVDKDSVLQVKYLQPGAYRVKVIKDDNRNGKWDTGNYLQRLQPEFLTFVQNNEGKPDFDLKANWELELDVDASKLFVFFESAHDLHTHDNDDHNHEPAASLHDEPGMQEVKEVHTHE